MAPKRRTYTIQQRVAAVASYYKAGRIYKKANALLLLAWLVQWGPLPATPANLIRRTVTKFEETGSVADKPRSGRPRKFSRAKARAAAKLFKQGYEVCLVYKRGQPPLRERRYYTSIKDALEREPRLEQIGACIHPPCTNPECMSAPQVATDVSLGPCCLCERTRLRRSPCLQRAAACADRRRGGGRRGARARCRTGGGAAG